MSPYTFVIALRPHRLKYWRLNPGQDSDTMDYPEAPGGEPVQNFISVRRSRRRSQVESRDGTAVDGSSPRSSEHGHGQGFDGRKYVVQPVTASGAVVAPGDRDPFGERLGDSGSPV